VWHWFAVLFLVCAVFSASVGTACSGTPTLRPELAKAATSALALSDALEDLIAQGKDTEEDRDAAYDLVKMLPAETAGDAFGHAAIAGRAAEKKGATSLFSSERNPTTLVSEAERFARLSREKDPDFRDGAATRMLGSLYVLAPADMLKHGDSEDGLAMLEQLATQKPNVPQNQLRLAEAYIALQDKDSARKPLCKAVEMRASLRRDDQALLDKLVDEMKPFKCSGQAPAAASAEPVDH
jgi:Tetratricopeptide repeat